MLAGKEVFFVLVGSIIFSSQVFIGKFVSPERSLLVIFLIAIAFVLGQKISEKISSWNSVDDTKAKRPLFLMGVELINDGSSEKEEKLYENLKLGVRTRRILFSIFIMTLLSFVSYFAYKTYLSVALLSFSLLAIINSSYIGHYLFITIINAVAVFTYTGFDENFSGVALAIYTFVLILVFYTYYKLELEKEQKTPRKFKEYLFKSIEMFVSLFLLYSIFSLALPEKVTFFNKKEVAKKLSKITSPKRKRATPLSIKVPPLDIKLDFDNMSMNLNAGLKKIEQIERSMEGIDNITPEMSINLENIKLDIKETQNSLYQMRGQGSVSPEQAKEMWNRLNSLQNKMKKMDFKYTKYHNSIKDSVEKYPSKTNLKLLKDLDSKVSEESLSELSKIAQKIETENIEVLKFVEEKMDIKKEVETQSKALAIEEIKEKKKEKKTQKILGHLKKLAKVALLLSGVFFILLLFKKNKKIDESKKDKEIINDLIADIKKVQRKKLTPNEEIIESYNVFKLTMKKIEFFDKEVPPPKVLFEHLLKDNSKYKDETWQVTDIFCNCYYGQKQATSQDLNLFRKSFLRVIRSFR